MKNPYLLTAFIVGPILIGAVVYDQRDNIFPKNPGPLIQPVNAVLDDSWDLEKLGGGVAAPKAEPPLVDRPQRPAPPPDRPPPSEKPPLPSGPVLYYGKTCPHCEKVLRYVQDGQIAAKTGLIEKEVYQNADNSKEALRAATSCGVSQAQMAVPFLFADGRCLFGETDVMARLKSLAGL